MKAYVCNSSTEEAETRGWIQLQSQMGLHSEFEARLNYGWDPVSKNKIIITTIILTITNNTVSQIFVVLLFYNQY